MFEIYKININQLSNNENPGLITHQNFALNRGVKVADAIGAVMKFGEPYRFMESRIVRVLKGFIRISVNLEEYRPIADEALYIGQNSVVEILEYSPDALVDLLGFALANKSANIRNLYHLSKECNSWLEMYFQLLHTLSRSEAFDMRSIDYLLQSLHCHIVAYHQHTCCGASQTKGRKEELFRKFIELLNIHIGKHKLPFYAEKMNISPPISQSIGRRFEWHSSKRLDKPCCCLASKTAFAQFKIHHRTDCRGTELFNSAVFLPTLQARSWHNPYRISKQRVRIYLRL